MVFTPTGGVSISLLDLSVGRQLILSTYWSTSAAAGLPRARLVHCSRPEEFPEFITAAALRSISVAPPTSDDYRCADPTEEPTCQLVRPLPDERCSGSGKTIAHKKTGLHEGSPAQGTSLATCEPECPQQGKRTSDRVVQSARRLNRLTAEAHLTETELGALEGSSSRSRSRRSRFRSGSLGCSRSSGPTAAAIAAAAAVATPVATPVAATMATTVAATMATTTATTMEQTTATTVACMAAAIAAITTTAAVATMATVTGDRLAVRAQEGNADHREKDRDAENQCTIHSKFLHTHGFRKGCPKQRLPSNASFLAHPVGRPPGQAKRLPPYRPPLTAKPGKPPVVSLCGLSGLKWSA